VKGLQHLCDLPPAEPAMLAAPLRRPILELARQERTSPLELAHDVAAKPGVLAQEVPSAPVPAVRRGAPAAPHQRADQRQRLDRPDESVPLEQLPLHPEQALELPGLE
jgi:hypothetical protein